MNPKRKMIKRKPGEPGFEVFKYSKLGFCDLKNAHEANILDEPGLGEPGYHKEKFGTTRYEAVLNASGMGWLNDSRHDSHSSRK